MSFLAIPEEIQMVLGMIIAVLKMVQRVSEEILGNPGRDPVVWGGPRSLGVGVF